MFGGISIWQLLIVLLLVVLLFGTKKLRNLGSDLGGAFKGFKKSMAAGEQEAIQKQVADEQATQTHNAHDDKPQTSQQQTEQQPNAHTTAGGSEAKPETVNTK